MMKLSEARVLWHRYVFLWKENAVSGPNEWAKMLLRKDMKIAQLKAEVNDTFHHWHRHSRRNYLHWQKALKKNAQLEAYCDKLANGLPDGMLPKDVELLRSANTHFAQRNFELEADLKTEQSAYRIAMGLYEYRVARCVTFETELADTNRHLETYKRMNDKTREALDCEGKGTVESIEQLKAGLENEKSCHHFALALLEKAIDGADKHFTELKAHRDNEGNECPLCIVETKNERLRDAINTALTIGYDAPEVWQGLRDALKEQK